MGPLLIVLGTTLLVVAATGDLTSIDGYKNTDPRSWERFDSSLV